MSKGAPEHIVELCNLSRPCSSLLGYYKDGPQSSMERIWRSTKKAPPKRGYGDNERGRAKDHNHGSLLVRNIPMNCRHEELRVLLESQLKFTFLAKNGLCVSTVPVMHLCFKRNNVECKELILVLTIAASSYYLRGLIRTHSPSDTFPCLILKKDNVITRKTVIIKNHYSNGADLKASCVLQIKKSTTMGVVGLPNVGKSSLINSLKRRHAVNVEATPGLTRFMQVVQLDKNVKLVDCIGVVMLKSGESDAVTALQNCIKIEKLQSDCFSEGNSQNTEKNEDESRTVSEIANVLYHEMVFFTCRGLKFEEVPENCQFHGFRDEDANEHLNKYLSITQFMKQNGVSQDSIGLNLFSFSLTHEVESSFYHLKTHSIHTWEEMILKFLSKYYPYSRVLQLRKEILNFRQLPTESVFEAWKRFKSCLQKCPDHRILLDHQILTFYYRITMIDRDKIMVAVGGNITRKTPQEAYDLIENMTQHHFQWDAEVYYDITTGASAHNSETTFALNSDESDEDEPSEVLDVQKPIHSLSGNPTPSSDYVVKSLSPLPTPFGGSDLLLEETDTLLSNFNDSSPDYETFCFNIREKSNGSATSHSDHSLSEYESFCFDVDHIEEKSIGNTTSHSDLSLLEYELFHFDLSIDPLPPVDRSDSHLKEFADELTHIISPLEYEYFYFDLEDMSSLDPPESTPVIDESTLLVSPLPDYKDISLREVERFDPFFSLT
ncbi:reverse transcriptase domain-containing protein [Tanacetum coccineum]